MWSTILLGSMISAAGAGTVQPSVTGLSDAKAVHVLFGQDGQTISTCLAASDGWFCSPVDVSNPTPVYLMVDTGVVDMGVVALQGADMTIGGGMENPRIEWRRSVSTAEGRANTVVVVRVRGAQPDQAPMIHLAAGAVKTQASCADDGRFPDGIPNDGLFHCASVLNTATLASNEWTLDVSMRMADGEVATLGTFPFSDETGLRLVSVSVGDVEAASAEFFALVGAKAQASDTPSMEEDGSNQAPLPPEEEVPQAGPKLFSGWVWSSVLAALSLGWLLGSRAPRGNRARDQAVALPAPPLDGRGPVPTGDSIMVSSADPAQTLLHVAKQLTSFRRVLVLGDVDCTDLTPLHPILTVRDPDRFSVQSLVQDMCRDGGVPPVLLIMGMESVLDTGSASPAPTQDLVDSIAAQSWSAVFVTEDETPNVALVRWGHDPQAGWSKL